VPEFSVYELMKDLAFSTTLLAQLLGGNSNPLCVKSVMVHYYLDVIFICFVYFFLNDLLSMAVY